MQNLYVDDLQNFHLSQNGTRMLKSKKMAMVFIKHRLEEEYTKVIAVKLEGRKTR
jgi:hypothetical protein